MSTTESTSTVEQAVRAALATVDDPEIHKPITDLGMVKGVAVSPDGRAHVGVYLTVLQLEPSFIFVTSSIWNGSPGQNSFCPEAGRTLTLTTSFGLI